MIVHCTSSPLSGLSQIYLLWKTSSLHLLLIIELTAAWVTLYISWQLLFIKLDFLFVLFYKWNYLADWHESGVWVN